MREIRIASLACTGEGGVEASLDRAKDMIVQACFDKPDLICLPELFAWTFLNAEAKNKAAEPIAGKFSHAMASLATRHGIHILAPLLERNGQRIYLISVAGFPYGAVGGNPESGYPKLCTAGQSAFCEDRAGDGS